jgi:hypothetical protein
VHAEVNKPFGPKLIEELAGRHGAHAPKGAAQRCALWARREEEEEDEEKKNQVLFLFVFNEIRCKGQESLPDWARPNGQHGCRQRT